MYGESWLGKDRIEINKANESLPRQHLSACRSFTPPDSPDDYHSDFAMELVIDPIPLHQRQRVN